MESKVSFTIRRPSPISRESSGIDSDRDVGHRVIQTAKRSSKKSSTYTSSPLAASVAPKRTHREPTSDSDDEDGEGATEDEIITGFDKFGVTRSRPKKKEGPLIIPALKNRDWREVAKQRRAPGFVPNSGAAQTGADGSVGGLGTRDVIGSDAQVVGLHVPGRNKKPRLDADDDAMTDDDPAVAATPSERASPEPTTELTDDQRAIRALIAASSGSNNHAEEEAIAAIPLSIAEREQAAFNRDITALPDSASLEDYERIPVSQFGAALLRGMGWKEGQAASRTRKGLVEPWVPKQRPDLLGLGAKEREMVDDGSKVKTSSFKKREEARKYMPLAKVEGEHSRSSSNTPSRRSSRERSPPRREHRRDGDRDRDRDKDRDRRRDRERDRDDRHRSRRDYDSDHGRSDRDYKKSRDYDSDRPRERRDRARD